jgi:general secretion pathway protein H
MGGENRPEPALGTTWRPGPLRAAGGFTLLELMIVLVVIGVAAAVVSLTLRDPSATQLEREAARLAALLESARAESRASGRVALWRPGGEVTPGSDAVLPGFRFIGLPRSIVLPSRWLDPQVDAQVVGAPVVVLGPEPLIGAQRIRLRLGEQQLSLATDGLGPFTVLDEAAAAGTR